MNKNLKNRPHFNGVRESKTQAENAVEDWFDGFEKELRELVKRCYELNELYAGNLINKEILGEE